MRRSGILLFGYAFAACGLFPDLGGLTADDGGADVTSFDARFDVSTTKCTGDAGPASVSIGTFCIDSTEVTNADYAAFLASNPSTSSLPSTCTGWKTTFQQKTQPPSGTDDYPAVFVDWCDAWAYCNWAGKRLCGRMDGGALATGAIGDVTQDEWFFACSGGGAFNYPYGGAFDAATCNGPEHATKSVLPAASLPNCQGGYPGIFEMVGNADEWIDSCKTNSGGPDAAFDNCQRHSGSFDNPDGSFQTCAFARANSRQIEDWDVGFRCCSDVAP